MQPESRYAVLWLGSIVIAFSAGLVATKVKTKLFPPEPIAYEFADTLAREETPCPVAGKRTLVAVILGQSLAGNWSGERTVGRDGVVNLYGGRCYRARDPLLGATGIAGNHWTQVANALVDSGRYDHVVLLEVTRGRSAITNFLPPNEGFSALKQEIAAKPDLAVTHVFIQQGQTDNLKNTPYEAYRASYANVLNNLRQLFPGAAVFVSLEAGYCRDDRANAPPSVDNPILKAQRSLIDPARGFFRGPEVDVILDASKRYDGCHPSGAGSHILAQAWTKVIEDHDTH